METTTETSNASIEAALSSTNNNHQAPPASLAPSEAGASAVNDPSRTTKPALPNNQAPNFSWSNIAAGTNKQPASNPSQSAGSLSSNADDDQPPEPTLQLLLGQLQNNIIVNNLFFDSIVEPPADESETIFGVLTHSVASFNGIGSLTRSKKRKFTHFALLPNGNKSSFTAIMNCDKEHFNLTDQEYTLFTIQKNLIKIDEGASFHMKDINILRYNNLDQYNEETINSLPHGRGKVTTDSTGKAVISVMVLNRGRNGNTPNWVKLKADIPFATEQHVSAKHFSRNDEVHFQFGVDQNNNPFAFNVRRAGTVDPSALKINGTNISHNPTKVKCDIRQTFHHTYEIDRYVEVNSEQCSTIFDQASHEVSRNYPWATPQREVTHRLTINLIPTPRVIASQQQNFPNFLTFGDIDEHLIRTNSKQRSWKDLNLDEIIEIFVNTRDKHVLADFQQRNLSLNSKMFDVVIFYSSDNISLATQQMVHRSFNVSRKNGHKLLNNLVVVDKHQPRNNIGSQTSCNKLTSITTDNLGHAVNTSLVMEGNNSLEPQVTTQHLMLSTYRFHDEGDKVTCDVRRLHNNPLTVSGANPKEFMVQYLPENTKVKTLLKELSDERATGVKHISLNYLNKELDEEQKTLLKKRKQKVSSHLSHGRFYKVKITILTGATSHIVDKFRSANALICPCCSTNEPELHLESKRYIPFPKELFSLVSKVKYIDILARNCFRIVLFNTSDYDNLHDLLNLNRPSETTSTLFVSHPNSPWAQITVSDKAILLSNDYFSYGAERQNTLYISGFDSIYDYEYMQRFIKYYFNREIKVVDSEQETTSGKNVFIRFLQPINNRNSGLSSYTASFTILEDENFQYITNQAVNIHSASRGKYSRESMGMSKLKLHSLVLGEKSTADDLTSSQNSALEDGHDEDDDFIPVQTRNKNNPPSQRQSNNIQSSNKYAVFMTGQDDSSSSSTNKNMPTAERNADVNDFNNTQDSLVQTWMNKNLLVNLKVPSMETEDSDDLHTALVKHLSRSSPNYHKKNSLPANFTQGGDHPGIGKSTLQALLKGVAVKDITKAINSSLSNTNKGTHVSIARKSIKLLIDALENTQLSATPTSRHKRRASTDAGNTNSKQGKASNLPPSISHSSHTNHNTQESKQPHGTPSITSYLVSTQPERPTDSTHTPLNLTQHEQDEEPDDTSNHPMSTDDPHETNQTNVNTDTDPPDKGGSPL